MSPWLLVMKLIIFYYNKKIVMRYQRFRLNVLLFFLLVAFPFQLFASEEKSGKTVRILRLSSNLDPEHPVQQAFSFMAQALHKVSEGQMKLIIYPSGQMGNVTDLIQQCQLGAMDMSKASGSDLTSFDATFSVFDLPYLFKNKEDFRRVVYGPAGREIMRSPEKNKGFFAIAAYQAGYRSFYAKKPIRAPSDLKGLKVRVQSSHITINMVRSLGGAPTPIPFGDTYTALEQGVVDVAENNVPSYVDTRHMEIAKYYSEDEHTSIPDFLIISTRTWNRLLPAEKKWLQQAAEASEKFQNKLWDRLVAIKRKTAKNAGVKFITVDRALFKQAVQPVYEYFESTPWKADLLKKIKNSI